MAVKKCMLTRRISDMAQLLVVLTLGIGTLKQKADRRNPDEPRTSKALKLRLLSLGA